MSESEAPAPLRSPQEMRLRSSRPPVTRLSRRVLLGLGIAAAIGICGALFLALRPAPRSTGSELYHTGDSATPDGLANLPRDYSGLPKAPALGAPLPGDLGRPIVQAGAPAPGPNPDQQRAQQEQEAALTSRLFATTAPSSVTASAAALPAIAAAAPTAATPAASPSGDATSQDHKLAFLNGNPDRHTVSAERVEPPPSPYVLQAGAVIAAALLTGIRSDLPGQVTAQVTEDVYDSPSGRFLLIPQGARLVGQYDAQVAFGQSRALVVWTRLIMPNGRSIVLEREPAADPQGYAGLEDEVDDHLGLLFKAAVLSTLLSVGAEAGESGNNQNAIAQAIRQGASQSINQTGAQVVGRSLNVQPTITIRPGFPVRVMVTRDLVLEPYRG